MRIIKDTYIYDTTKSTVLYSYDDCGRTTTLYKTPNGKYFTYTPYATDEPRFLHTYSPTEAITWLSEHGETSIAEQEFPELLKEA